MNRKLSAEFVTETVQSLEMHIAYLKKMGLHTEADETWVKLCQFLSRVNEVNGH